MILCGDALSVLRTLPSESVDLICTSPPYWGLRNYSGCPDVIFGGDSSCEHAWLGQRKAASKCNAWKGQLGLEPTVALYVEHLVEIFVEAKRVLKPTGVLCLNLGDSYYTGAGSARKPGGGTQGLEFNGPDCQPNRIPGSCGKLPKKSLIGIPWRVAFALADQGYILRNDIIWEKPDAVPESAKDRCTRSHEYIFVFSKGRKYWSDMKAIAQPSSDKEKRRWARSTRTEPYNLARNDESNGQVKPGQNGVLSSPVARREAALKGTRNCRSVWTMTTGSLKGHGATFPAELPRRCIKAWCPPGGTVMDIFGGSGSTAKEAAELGREYIIIELNPAYLPFIDQKLGLFAEAG